MEPLLRFKADDGSKFPKWEEHNLSMFLDENRLRNVDLKFGKKDVLSVSGDYGVVNQIEFQGRSFAGKSVQQYHILPHNGIVYTKSPLKANPYGIIKANKGVAGIVSTLYAVFDCKNNVIPEFVDAYFDLDERLNKYLKPLVNIGAKHDMKISNERFLSGRVCFPSLPEQRKIASFLSTIDEIIQSTESELTAWQERKKGVMQKIFNREVRFKADDGSEFPEWEEKRLGEVGTFIKGAALSKADISNTGTPFVLYGELYTTYKEIAYTIKRKTEAVVDEKYYSKIGDVAIPTSGESPEEISTATCIMVPNVILAGDLNIFRSSIIDGRIMSYILNYQAKNKIATIAQGKSIVHIQAKELSKIKIKFPIDVNEQCKIAECLSSIDDVISNIQAELSAWKEFKKGLLQQMFV